MGNETFIQNERVYIKTLRSRLEAIQKLQPLLQQKDEEALQEWLIFQACFSQNYRNY